MSTVAHCPMPEAWPLLPSSLQKALDPHLDVLTTSSCVQLDSDSPVSQEYDVPEDGSVAWLPTVQFPCYLLFKYYQQILQQYVTRIKNSVKLAMLWKVKKFMYTMYTITDLKTTKRQACRYHNTLPPIRPLTCIQKKSKTAKVRVKFEDPSFNHYWGIMLTNIWTDRHNLNSLGGTR